MACVTAASLQKELYRHKLSLTTERYRIKLKGADGSAGGSP